MEMNNTTPMTTNFEQIKSESSTRSQRIGKILRAAFTQTSTELKEGYTIVRPLATEMSSTVVEDLKQKSNQASSTLKDAWHQEPATVSVWDRWQRVLGVVVTAMRDRLAPPIKKQATRVDSKFTDQYGNSYTTMKRGFQAVKNWYVRSTDTHDASNSHTKQMTVIPNERVTVDVVASPIESTAQ